MTLTRLTMIRPAGCSSSRNRELRRWLVSGKGGLEVWRLSALTAIGAYSEMDGQLTSDADGSPSICRSPAASQTSAGAPGNCALNGRTVDRVDWTLGGFYYESTATNRQTVRFPPTPVGAVPNPPASTCCGPRTSGSCGSSIRTVNLHVRRPHNVHDVKSCAGFAHVAFDPDRQALQTRACATRRTRRTSISTTRLVPEPINIKVSMTITPTGGGLTSGSTDTTMVLCYGGHRVPTGAYNPRPFLLAGSRGRRRGRDGLRARLQDRPVRADAAHQLRDLLHGLQQANRRRRRDGMGVRRPRTAPDLAGGPPLQDSASATTALR